MFEAAKPFLLSLALGLLIGIERERALTAEHADKFALGARTFALLALLGCMASSLDSTAMTAVVTAAAAAIVLASYVKTPGPDGLGATTEVAALATFVLGYLAQDEPKLTALLGVVLVSVLALKPRIHQFAHRGLEPAEVTAALTFLVIAFVILPLLPDRAIDPWGLINPSKLWLLFVLIAGMSFGGYIAVRALGPARGLAAAGFFAGLVSSTAATLSFARRARQVPGHERALAIAIVLANVASAAAQIFVVAIANREMTQPVLILIGAPVATGIAAVVIANYFVKAHTSPGDAQLAAIRNPLELRSAAKLAAGLGAFLIAAGFAVRTFGAQGAIAAAAIGGMADVHAVSLGVATLASAGSLEVKSALLAILIAFSTNMLVKLGLVTWAGGLRLAFYAAPPMIAMAVAAIATFSLMRL